MQNIDVCIDEKSFAEFPDGNVKMELLLFDNSILSNKVAGGFLAFMLEREEIEGQNIDRRSVIFSFFLYVKMEGKVPRGSPPREVWELILGGIGSHIEYWERMTSKESAPALFNKKFFPTQFLINLGYRAMEALYEFERPEQ